MVSHPSEITRSAKSIAFLGVRLARAIASAGVMPFIVVQIAIGTERKAKRRYATQKFETRTSFVDCGACA